MSTLMTITVWQPWATLIAEQCKPWEFRGHSAPKYLVGKRIAIHAGMRAVSEKEVRALLVKLHSDRFRETGLWRQMAIDVLERVVANHFRSGSVDSAALLPRGSVVCTALLGKPVRGAELAERLGISNDSDRTEHSNWGWPLSDIERLTPPVPATGRQGWWPWTPPA